MSSEPVMVLKSLQKDLPGDFVTAFHTEPQLIQTLSGHLLVSPRIIQSPCVAQFCQLKPLGISRYAQSLLQITRNCV